MGWLQQGALRLSADGKHAYVTGDGDYAVSWFGRNASTGELTYAGMLKDGVNGVDGLDGAISVTLSAEPEITNTPRVL